MRNVLGQTTIFTMMAVGVLFYSIISLTGIAKKQ